MPEDTRPRGRPWAARASDVAAIGLRMFARDGFEATTVTDIAKAAGISRTTLFRYFPSKADIAWDRTETEAEWLRVALAEADPDEPPLRVLCRVVPQMFRYTAADLDLLRTQIDIITTVPSVGERATAWTARLSTIMSEFVAQRIGGKAGDLLPSVMSCCVESTGWAALRFWASSTEESPDEVLETAFAELRDGFPGASG